MSDVTVAIPVRNGGELLGRTLDALRRQTVVHEVLICDSGSTDGSLELARSRGARMLEISPASFTHGGTRNLLLGEARGAYVALLTQDAEPADERWLERLLAGFALAPDVGVVYGPYRPRPEASLAVRLELERWFTSLAPDGLPRIERLAPEERAIAAVELIGRRGFLTDANACLARSAWQEVPYRDVPYAEDRVLAVDMLRAGYTTVFMPEAAVCHSHRYGTLDQLRRGFDEWRGLLEVYGWREPAGARRLLGQLRGELGHARRAPAYTERSRLQRAATLAALSRHHMTRLIGAQLGSRADQLPPKVRRRLSLERRASFVPLDLDSLSTAPRSRNTDHDR